MIYPMQNWNYNGYEFLNKVSTFVRHSGQDFNRGSGETDNGDNVFAITDMEIIYIKDTKTTGWGRVIIGYSRRYDRYFRYAHLKQINVKVGAKIKEGDIIALVGGSGHNSESYWPSHLHFDVIIKKLEDNNWLKYTTYYSEAKIREYYENPLVFIKEKIELEKLDTEDPEIVKWAKDNKLITKWELPYKEADIKQAFIAYKICYMTLTPSKRAKVCTIKGINLEMDSM